MGYSLITQHNYKSEPESKSSSLVGFVKVHAGLAAAALKRGLHAGFAVWLVGRAIDNAGSGRVDDDDMRQAFFKVGWSDYKYRRARFEALRAGLIHFSSGTIYLRSLEKAAYALGAERIGILPIGVSVEALATVKGWRAALRDVFLAQTKEPRPISRAAIQAATGLSPNTQSRYNKMNRQRVNVVHNFARLVHHFDPMDLAGVKETDPSVYYKNGALWRTLPATYDVNPAFYPRLKRGRTRRAQGALNHLRSVELVNNAAGERSDLKRARRYHDDRQSAGKALKQVGQGKRAMPEEMYVLAQVRESDNGHKLFAQWYAWPEREYDRVEV